MTSYISVPVHFRPSLYPHRALANPKCPIAIRRHRSFPTCCTSPSERPASEPSDPTWSILRDRISDLQQKEVARDRTIANNWRKAKYTTAVVASVSNTYVRKLSFHADFLVCGTSSGGLVFSDLVSGMRLACPHVHTGQVTAVDYNHSFAASAGSVDFDVAVWRISQYEVRSFWNSRLAEGGPMEGKLPEPYLKVQGHTDIITAVAVDAASGCVYSASVDGTVRVVDLETGDLRFEVRVGEPILSMALTDSHHLLLGCSSGRVQAYETEKGLYLLSIICHKSNVTAIDFWDESQTLVTGDSSGNIRLWSFKDSSFLGALPQHDAAVMSLQIDSSKVVSAARDGCVAVSILDKLERKYSIVGFTKYLSSVAFDQARLIADGTNNIIVCHRFDSDANEIT